MGLDKNKVEIFIKEALKYDGDKYSQPKRLQKGYSDCSSLIQKPLNTLGWNTRPNVAVTTHRMGVEGDSRFKRIDMSELQRGDLVWYRNDKNGVYFGHVGIYLGNNQVFEAIYAGISTYPLSRIRWQRAYRVKALEASNIVVKNVVKFTAKGIVTANVLNVRSANSVNAEKVGTLKKGQEIQISAKADDWFELNYNGKNAYVSAAYIDLKNTTPAENIQIFINGNFFKKGYIVDGVTYAYINNEEKAIRNTFESIGAKV
ncbi:SH3 domain-containing protein, partial [Peptoniphilus asaccharolyticus]